MSNWKLIALDMDGTTLDRTGSISIENRDAIRRARAAGIEVTFATGRHINGPVDEFARELQLTAPLVTVNGSEVWHDGKLLCRHTLTTEDVAYLCELAQEHQVHFWAATVEHMVYGVVFPKQLDEYTWLKFGFRAENSEVIQQLWETLSAFGRFELSNSDPLNIEINPKGVSKASGLQVVSEALGIEAGQVVVMGDSLNDLSMIRWAGLGVAMGNAQDEVKAIADRVTTSFDKHGVAQAIDDLLLEFCGV